MARYSIEILDGERQGEVLPIPEGRFTIGRKSGNSLVLHDEKVSGVHAEIVAETDSVVLRDLGSTNGTRIENRKIDEVPLSPGDVIQIGLTRLKFAPEEGGGGAAEGGADVAQIHRVGASELARARGRKRIGTPVLLFFLLVLVGGGLAYWRFVLSGGGVILQGKPPQVVAGNLLQSAAADLEGAEAYEPVGGGAAFAPSARAHTGNSALEVLLTKEAPFAAARLKEAVKVTPGQTVTLRIQVSGDATAAAGPRALFLSSTDGARSLVAGGPLRKSLSAKYETWEAEAVAPQWADRAAVLLLAAGEGRAVIDDVVLLQGGSTRAGEVVVGQSRKFHEGGGWITADAAVAPLFRAIKPSVSAPDGDLMLAGLVASGFLVFSDVATDGARPKLEEVEGRVRLTCAGPPDLSITLVLPAANLFSGRVALVGPDDRFGFHGDRFDEPQAKGVLVGEGLAQVLVTVPEAGRIHCVPQGEDLAITLPRGGTVEFKVEFTVDRTEVHNAVRLAKRALENKRLGEAIGHYAAVIHKHPFVPDEVEKAIVERSRLLDDLRQQIEDLDRKIASADFFKTLGGYDETLEAANDLAGRYEGADEQALQHVRSRVESLEKKRSEIVQRENQRARDTLQAVVEVLEADKRTELVDLLKGYIEKHFGSAPTTRAAKREKN